jgi:hypothetical protein
MIESLMQGRRHDAHQVVNHDRKQVAGGTLATGGRPETIYRINPRALP